ncbi:MAG: hypothetical protein CL842_11790 [Crocinitomicaceae bacterium]|nr:hypothetical protein [Crocinitomicaceae bacterium]|tara:strand:+ start:1030 stop:1632 length:603 start_codon:yes stop_codon:yes gene_type:complete
MKTLFFILPFQLFFLVGYSQIHCGSVDFVTNSPVSLNLPFTSFSDYASGVTIIGAATLKLSVSDKAIVDPDCRWRMEMQIENGSAIGNDWETLVQFGSGVAPNPTLNILEVRISNNCATGIANGIFTKPFTSTLDIQDIIAASAATIAAGSCTPGVNGPGNYLENYDEYTFRVDVRVKPGLIFSPGIYQVNLKFHIEEVN